MFAEDDIIRRKAERNAADRAYNEALTELDTALPKPPNLPHPPVSYDESQLPALNERWTILAADPLGSLAGWRRRLAALVWQVCGAPLQRQQAFNAALVDHVNRNVEVHRATRVAIESTVGALRAEMEKLETFHAKLILYLQTITLFVDTKDRSEHIATLTNLTNAGLSGVADEFRRRWESMQARDQRYVAAVDELRTTIGNVQQTGLMLKRELERILTGQAVASTTAAPAAAAPTTGPGASAAASPVVPPAHPPASILDTVNAYKYVGFENKFRGSEADIRERQLAYVDLFRGASDVLDLGCGRGEFLALLRAHGITGRGLDINHEMVEVCRSRGLDAAEGDALAYLDACPDGALGGLIALQVVEHFPPGYLVRFLDVAFHKLRPGARIVLETLNPACWFAFFEAYIRDITHAWPLHPDTLKYLVVASGFQRVDVRFMSPYPSDARLQQTQMPSELATLQMGNMVSTFNENVEKLNAVMFSYLDYAVVGERL